MGIYQDYSKYVSLMQETWDTLCVDLPFDNIYNGLSSEANRNYDKYGTLSSRTGLRNLLEHTGLGFVYYDGKIDPRWGTLGIISRSGDLLLNGRYIVPIRDVVGNIVAIVGWQKGASHKYVTAAASEVKVRRMWFGMEQLTPEGMTKINLPYYSNHRAIICEGIYDTLSARALGFPAYGAMGIRLTKEQRDSLPLLSMGGKIVAIPDMDEEGEGVVHWDNWHMRAVRGTYFRFMTRRTGVTEPLKDIDDLIAYLGEDTARGYLDTVFKSKSLVSREFHE